MKRRDVILCIICLILSPSRLFMFDVLAEGIQILERIDPKDPNVRLAEKGWRTDTEMSACGHRMSDQCPVDTLSWRTLSEPGMNFAALTWGDSLAVWFDPLAACTVKAIRIRNMTFEGNMFISIKSSRYDGHISTKDSTDVNGWIGTFEGSQWIPGDVMGYPPLGDLLWGPFPLTVTDHDANSWMTVATAPTGEPVLDGEPFFVAIEAYLTEGWGIAGELEAPLPYHFFKYYAGDTGPDQTHKGWFLRSFTLWIEAIVVYFENTPPVIKEMDDLQFTYSSGPYTVHANIKDSDFEHPERAGVASVYLHWNIEGIKDSILMMGPTGENIFSGEIPSVNPGDTVSYHITAIDEPGLRSTTAPHTFARLEPANPQADILLVSQNSFSPLEFYRALLDSLDFRYEYWDIQTFKGIDESILNWGWTTTILFGYPWGSILQLPTRGYEGNAWSAYLNTGKNLLYIDDLYYWFNDEPDIPTFAPGDFACDYFGLESGLTDASNYWDPALHGIPDDPISGDFIDTPIEQTWLPSYYNWIAYTTTSEEGVDIFFNDYEDGCGSRYTDGHFKTVFLPWIMDGLMEDTGTDTVPKACVYTLMQNVLDWFGTAKTMAKGDVTRDGQTNVIDLINVANIILGIHPSPSAFELWAADCNGDETINVLDMIGIVNVILGIGSCAP